MNHTEFSRKGGLSKSEKKRNAGIMNLKKAREARAAKLGNLKPANNVETISSASTIPDSNSTAPLNATKQTEHG